MVINFIHITNVLELFVSVPRTNLVKRNTLIIYSPPFYMFYSIGLFNENPKKWS
jgi:hypothetical protein